MSLLSVSFSCSGAHSATVKFIMTAKLIETICFSHFAIFLRLFNLNFEFKYLKKLEFWI